MLPLGLEFRPRKNLQLTASTPAPAFFDDATFQITKPFISEAKSDFFEQVAAASLETVHIALIEPVITRLMAIGLPQDAAHKLS